MIDIYKFIIHYQLRRILLFYFVFIFLQRKLYFVYIQNL